MSRRITTKTEITDRNLAEQALKQLGLSYNVRGDTIEIGGSRGAVLNLKTGEIVGDSDFGVNPDKLATAGSLAQVYGELKCRAIVIREGHTITSRVVEGQDVVLYCRMA